MILLGGWEVWEVWEEEEHDFDPLVSYLGVLSL